MSRLQTPRITAADPSRLADQLLNDASLGLTAVDTQFNFTLVNAAFANAIGYSADELLGASSFDFVHPGDLKAMADSAAQLEETGHGIVPVPTPFRCRHIDGHYVAMEVWLQSLDRSDSPYHMIFAIRSAEPSTAIDRYVEATINGDGLDVSFRALADSVESTFPCDILIYWGWNGHTFTNVIGNDLQYVERNLLGVQEIDLESTDLPGWPTALATSVKTGTLTEHISFADYPESVRQHAIDTNAFACQVLPMRYQSDVACIVMWNRQRTPVATDHRRAGIGARLILERTARLGTLALQRWSTDARVAREMRTDSLTQVTNRFGFMEELHKAWDANEDAWLLVIDVDGFKSVNDQYGHLAGDTVLSELAQRFRKVVSSRDIVARLGGDEFALLIRANTRAQDRLTSDTRLATLVASLREVASHPISLAGRMIHSAISVGTSEICLHADSMAAMGAADRAMYADKQNRQSQPATIPSELIRLP